MNDKEAIERLNRFKTIKVMYGNTFVMHLEQLKQLQQDLETILNLIENQKAEIEKKDKIIKMLTDEREYIKNNLEVDLNRKGVFSQAKGQISQILECYKNNDEYFEKKAEEEK